MPSVARYQFENWTQKTLDSLAIRNPLVWLTAIWKIGAEARLHSLIVIIPRKDADQVPRSAGLMGSSQRRHDFRGEELGMSQQLR